MKLQVNTICIYIYIPIRVVFLWILRFFLLACHKFENSSRYESIHSGLDVAVNSPNSSLVRPSPPTRGISFYQLPKIHASREIILTRYCFFSKH